MKDGLTEGGLTERGVAGGSPAIGGVIGISGDGTAGRAPRVPEECGDLPFLIKRDGGWLYKGTSIGRKELVCLFASVLKREVDGSFWLETPAERGRIVVEDAPFVAVEMDWNGSGEAQVLTFRTNIDEIICADLEHPLRFGANENGRDPKPYIRLRPGLGSFPVEARISRPVFYELAALAEPHLVRGRLMLGVWSSGIFFPMGEMPNDDA